MSDPRPSGTTRDSLYVFSKVFVHDLDAMAAFYQDVFGLIPFNRHQDAMFGRSIDEITHQSSFPGGPALTLISFLDSTGPLAGESVQGFTSTDLEALVQRALVAGGRVPDPIRHIPEFQIKVVFVLDPEGHVNEVVQLGVV